MKGLGKYVNIEFFTNRNNGDDKINGLYELLIVTKKSKEQYYINQNYDNPVFNEYEFYGRIRQRVYWLCHPTKFIEKNLNRFIDDCAKYKCKKFKLYRQIDRMFVDEFTTYHFLEKISNEDIKDLLKKATFKHLIDNEKNC